jgi:hypothetical protein
MDSKTSDQPTDQKTGELLELCGTWEDDRPVEEIIKDIYDSRTSSQRKKAFIRC